MNKNDIKKNIEEIVNDFMKSMDDFGIISDDDRKYVESCVRTAVNRAYTQALFDYLN